MIKRIAKLFPSKLKHDLYTWWVQLKTYQLTFVKKNFTPKSSLPSPYKYQINSKNILSLLGEKYQPTKRLHNYLIHYWKHFRDIHMSVTRVLEIGVQTDRSIKMWEEFFPNAVIYGIDIDPDCINFTGGRKKIFIGDQSDEKLLQKVLDDAGGYFDIIIDDGSHRVYHQLKSFDFLFPNLSSHGIYVIEDTGACVGDVELKTINKIKKLVDNIMYFPNNFPFDSWSSLSNFPETATWADKNIIGISFYRWICFIEKGNNPSDNPYLQLKNI